MYTICAILKNGVEARVVFNSFGNGPHKYILISRDLKLLARVLYRNDGSQTTGYTSCDIRVPKTDNITKTLLKTLKQCLLKNCTTGWQIFICFFIAALFTDYRIFYNIILPCVPTIVAVALLLYAINEFITEQYIQPLCAVLEFMAIQCEIITKRKDNEIDAVTKRKDNEIDVVTKK